MKQIIQFIALVAIVFAGLMTTGCNSSEKKVYPSTIPVTVTVTTDTTINVKETTNKTADRYDCNGKKLKNPKLLAVDTNTVAVNISQTGTKNIDVDCTPCLQAAGLLKDGDNKSSSDQSGSGGTSNGSNGGRDWSWLLWIPVIIGIILALWFASWLIKNWPTWTSSNSSSQKNYGMFSKSAVDDKRLTGLQALHAQMVGPSGDSKGYVKSTTSCGDQVEMMVGATPTTPAGITVTNSGSGTVNVHVGNVKHVNSHNGTIPSVVEPKKDEPAK